MLTNVRYQMMLRTDIAEETKQKFPGERLTKAIYAAMKTILGTQKRLENFDIAMYGNENDYLLLYIIFWFPDSKSEFLEAIDVARDILSNTKALETSQMFKCKVRLFSDVSDLMGTGVVVDLKSGRQLETKRKFSVQTKWLSRAAFSISPPNFCYRVKLNYSDVVFTNGRVTIKNSGREVLQEDVDTDAEDGNPVVRAEDFLPDIVVRNTVDTTNLNRVSEGKIPKDADISDVLSEKGLYALVSLLTLALIVVCCCKICRSSN